MAVKESEKTYIECRMIILGEKNVGKKSFIGKLLSVSSTSMIRNYEAEKEFNKKLDELRKRVEREEELLIQSEQEKYRTYNTKSDSNILDNSLTKNKKQNNRSKSKESEEKKFIKKKKKISVIKLIFYRVKLLKVKYIIDHLYQNFLRSYLMYIKPKWYLNLILYPQPKIYYTVQIMTMKILIMNSKKNIN